MTNDDQFKNFEQSIERFASAVSEEISELKGDVANLGQNVDGLRKEVKDGFAATSAKMAGVHRRIDEELDKRRQLEVRIDRLEEKVG